MSLVMSLFELMSIVIVSAHVPCHVRRHVFVPLQHALSRVAGPRHVLDNCLFPNSDVLDHDFALFLYLALSSAPLTPLVLIGAHVPVVSSVRVSSQLTSHIL
jgi:hypothetical protein